MVHSRWSMVIFDKMKLFHQLPRYFAKQNKPLSRLSPWLIPIVIWNGLSTTDLKYLKHTCLALFAILLFIACENDVAEVQRVISQDEKALERARDVEILYSDSAIVRIRIQAYTMYNHLDKKEPRREFPQGFIVDFFDERKQSSSKLSANYAMHYINDGKIHMQDSVVVWNRQGDRFEAEDLIWDEKGQKVYSEEFVKISTPEQIIYGYGFTSDLEFNHWKLKQITGEVDAGNFSEEEQ